MRTATASAPRDRADAISMVWLKDPTNPRWASDRGVRLYRQIMARYCPGCRARRRLPLRGHGVRVHDGRRAATCRPQPHPRASLLRAATNLRERDNPFLLPGVTVQTTPTSYFPISKAQLYRYRGGRWQPFSGLLGAKG